MTSSFKGGTFNQIQTADYAPGLQQGYAQRERGYERVRQAMVANQKTAEIKAGKQFEQLAELSGTVNAWVEQATAKRQQREIQEGLEWYYQNGYPQEKADTFEEAEKDMVSSGVEAYKMADEYFQSNEGDIWTSEKFRSLSDAQKYGAIKAWAVDQANMYNPNSIPQISEATDPTERNAALAAYRMNFWKQMGGINEGLVAKYVTPVINASERSSYSSWNTKRTAEILAQRQEVATKNLNTAIKGEDAATALTDWSLLNEGLYGSKRLARKAAIEIAKNMAANGDLTDEQIAKLGQGEFVGLDGSTKVFRDYYSNDFEDIEDAKFQKDKQDQQDIDDKRTLDAKTYENQQFEKYTKNPELITRPNLTKDREFFASKGYSSEKIDNLYNHLNIKKREINKFKNLADQAIEEGMYTQDLHDSMPPTIRFDDKYSSQAKKQTLEEPVITLHHKSIDTLVKGRINVSLMSPAKTGDSLQLAFRMKSRYNELWKQLEQAGEENAHQKAYDAVEEWFNKTDKENPRKFVDTSTQGYNLAYTVTNRGGNAIAPLSADMHNKLNDVRRYINTMTADEALDAKAGSSWLFGSDTAFFSHDELLKEKKSMGTHGWRPNERIKWISRMTGKSYTEVVNRQLKAFDDKELDESPAIKKSEELPKDAQTLLNQAETPAQYCRAWGAFESTGEDGEQFLSEIVPDNLGEDVWEYSKAFGVNAAELAAANELLLSDQTIEMFEPDSEEYKNYWRAIYKYSGGTHPDALTKLIRF